MEIRRLSLCLAFLLVAVISHSSEARHSLSRREADADYIQDGSDNEQADEGDDDEAPVPTATILTPSESYKVPLGKGVHLQCQIDIQDAMVTWMKGDIGLVVLGNLMADNKKYQKSGTDLIIHNVTQADAGSYLCKVEQTPPAVVHHEVVVIELAKITDITATDFGKPAPGSDLTLTCTATGFPAPKIIWTKWINGTNTNVGEGPSYTIKNVKTEDSGRFYCYAVANKSGDTRFIDISVQRKPKVHVHRTVINSAIGVEAFMQCTVHEEEPVEIRWYKGQQEIDSSLYSTQGKQSNFTVTPRSDADFGTYTCRAICDFGEHHRSIELVERPIVERLESDGAKLSWLVHSHQPLRNVEIQLMDVMNGTLTKFNVPVPDRKNHEYDFSYVVGPNVKPGNYEVLVKVENSKGMSEGDSAIVFEQVKQDPEIQEARLGPSLGGGAYSHHPTTALVSTVLMYLLVRML